jgi:hypothetical protein
VIVGLFPGDPHLRALGSAKDPKTPLYLLWSEWKALRDSANGRVDMVNWACEDHASEVETRIRLRFTPEGIEGDYQDFACRKDGKRGRLLETRPLEAQQ